MRLSTSLLAGCALVLVLGTQARGGGVPPEWCLSAGAYPLRFQTLGDALDSDDPQNAIPALVAALCQPETEAKARAHEVEAARQRWSKRLDLAYEDWADATAWATTPPAARNVPALRADGHRAWSSLGPVDQYLWLTTARAERGDPAYLADALGARLSECGRLAYLEACLGDGSTSLERAVCHADVLAFDPHKVAAEVHADQGHDGYTRFVLRLSAFRMVKRVLDPTSRGSALSQEVITQRAKAATLARDWERRATTEAPLRAFTASMEDAAALAPFRAPAGCDARAWPAWQSAIAGIPAARFSSLRLRPGRSPLVSTLELVLREPAGYLAAVSLYLCRALNRPDALVRSIGELLRRLPAIRGPRTAGLVALATLGTGSTTSPPLTNHAWFGALEPSSASLGATLEGTIERITIVGDSVQLGFATQQIKEARCAARGASNQLTQVVSADGLVDERTCLKETEVRVARRPAPRSVQRRYADGLRRGLEVWLLDDVVVLAWPRAKAPLPTTVLGAVLRSLPRR